MAKDMYELIKSAVWDNGVEAIDDLLGYEINLAEDKATIENRMDAALEQMPLKEVIKFYNRYCEKVYKVTTISDLTDCIPDAEHIEKDDKIADELGITEDIGDFDAARIAESDGIKLITDIEGIYKDFYVDTESNRAVIEEYIRRHPQKVGRELIGKFN